MVRIAVLGCGRIGRMHAANIAAHARCTLAGVFDVHAPAAQAVADAHGVPVLASAKAVFAAAEIDAVLIATSTDTHAGFIEQAVAAGKPVLCEKPIDLSLARVKDCAARIAGSDVPIQLGFNRRFDAGHRAASDLMTRNAGTTLAVAGIALGKPFPGLPGQPAIHAGGINGGEEEGRARCHVLQRPAQILRGRARLHDVDQRQIVPPAFDRFG